MQDRDAVIDQVQLVVVVTPTNIDPCPRAGKGCTAVLQSGTDRFLVRVFVFSCTVQSSQSVRAVGAVTSCIQALDIDQ